MIKAWLKKLPVLLLIIAFASFTFPRTTFAAIAFGASTRGDNFGDSSATTVTWDSPSVSGTNLLAVVGVIIRGSGMSVSSVTWDGVGMTLAPNSSITANGYLIVWYYLANPSTGVSTVVINGSNFTSAFGDAAYYTDVDQTNPIGDANTSSNTSTNGITGNFTLSNDDMYIHDAEAISASCTLPNISVGTKDLQGCDGTFSFAWGYRGPLSSGSQTISWVDGTFNHTRSGIGINPSVVASGYLAKQEIIVYWEE